ncbi:MAG: hypothetical protein WDN31_17460 [Hyphomicrobium sp.]
MPNDPVDPLRPRSRAEFTLICHMFLDDFEIDVFEPGPFEFADGIASTEAIGVFRHKKTGKILQTTFQHAWRVVDGKVLELWQGHDMPYLKAFIESIENKTA